MFCLVLLTGFLKADGFQLVRNRFSGLAVICHAKQLVQFLDAGLFPGCELFQRINFALHGMQSCVQIISGVEVLGFQIADCLRQLFQIGDPGLAAVCAFVAVVIVGRQQLRQRRWLWPGQLGFHFFQPVDQGGDFLFCLPEHGVGFPDPAVEIALIGADALGLHRPDSRPLMLGGYLFHTLTLKAAVVDAAIQTLLGKLCVAQVSPCLPPCFQCFRLAPVGGGDGVEHIVPGLVPDAFTMLVQHIFPPLFVAPFSVWQDRPDGTHDMKMRVPDTAVLLVRLVNGKVHHHAPAHKIVQQKSPCKVDVLFHGELVLQGNVKTICKLCFGVFLDLLHGIPEGFPVYILRRSVRWQQDFRTDHAALAGVVAVLAVILAVQLFAGAIGGSSHGRLSSAALDLGYMKMIQCDSHSPPNSILLCSLTASMSKPLTSGKARAFSAKA